MDDIQRLDLEHRLLREIDRVADNLREQLRDKADRRDITVMATEMSRVQTDQAERNRAIRESLMELEKGIKSLSALVAVDVGGPMPSRFSLRGMDPRILLAAGIVGGAAAGKSIELLLPMIMGGG